MIQELTFRSEDSKESPGRGVLTRHGRAGRATKATLYALIGLLLGLSTVVPGPHMCVTWTLPFVGAFVAWRAWSLDAELSDVEGVCPACDAAGIKLPGGPITVGEPLRQVCSKCLATFEVVCEPGETKQEG